MGKLTIKQEKFCNRYLECGNASEAYRFAYSCSNMSEETVWNNAYKLLQKDEVKTRIEYLKSHLAEAAGISALQIIREHQKIAFSDATRIRNGWMELKEFESLTEDEKACIKSVKTKQVKRVDRNGDEIVEDFVKIECYDKQKSLDSIMNMLGYAAPKELKLSGEVKNPVSVPPPIVIQINSEDALSIEKTPPADAHSS
jgi:phage terminase small subunit